MKLINRPWKKISLFVLYIALVSLGVVFWFKVRPALSPTIPPNNSAGNTSKKETIKPAKSFDKNKYSKVDPSSLWIIVNKQHPLNTTNYVPDDLVTTVGATISNKAKLDFNAMNTAALADGVNFTINSSYRSYSNQKSTYNTYVATRGQVSTDAFSARPGFSEHQTGLALDLGSSVKPNCDLDECFGDTVEGKWLAEHANEYGFLLRYTADKQQITGYMAQPWHFRYVGRNLTAEMKKEAITTLEEFFKISGGEKYI